MRCRICESNQGEDHLAKEMMFGSREEFSYFECSSCGCIQIEKYPEDISRFYDRTYFSFRKTKADRGNLFAFWLRKRWVDNCVGENNAIGAMLGRLRPVPALYSIFKKYGITRNSRILDVGCGNGSFLCLLYRAGFSHLTGIDPFIEKDMFLTGQLQLKKRDISEENEAYDYISFNNSFEHLGNQKDVLMKTRNLLTDGGIISISIPVTGFAWRKYGVNWVQLDAPRHFYIHSLKSLGILVEQAGLSVCDVFYNSDEFQFWGSEQYSKGIPLASENSYWVDKDRSIFTAVQITEFRNLAQQLNDYRDGDQAVFILRQAG